MLRANSESFQTFEYHLKQIFKEYSEELNKDDNLSESISLSKICFLKYLHKIPIVISERIFNSFNILKNNNLSYNDLEEPFTTLRFGTYDKILKILFNIFDFNKDGHIHFSDIEMLLSFLPTKLDKSIKEVNELLKQYEKIDFLVFLSTFFEDLNTNIMISFLNFLYESIPLFQETSYTKLYRPISKSFFSKESEDAIDLNDTNDVSKKSIMNSEDLNSFYINKFPRRTNTANMDLRKFNIPNYKLLTTGNTGNIGTIELRCLNSAKSSHSYQVYNNNLKSNMSLISNISSISNSNTVGSRSSSSCNSNLIIPSVKDFEDNSTFEEQIEQIELLQKNDTNKESSFYISVDNENQKTQILSKMKVKIINNSIYFYDENQEDSQCRSRGSSQIISSRERSQSSPESSINSITQGRLVKSYLLAGSFIRKNNLIKIKSEPYYSFSIFFINDKKETLYHKDNNVMLEWSDYLRKLLQYRNIFEYYTLNTILGEGSQGEVFYSENLKTREEVAVKILKKKSEAKSNWASIKSEIDIMKNVNHPNIIRFIDNFENSEYNFIVMEYLKYGSLQKFLNEQKFKLNENSTVNIAYHLAEGLKYLHSIGIVHRDLKPDNIMFTYSDDVSKEIKVKITDFGLSKVLGYEENSSDIGGTILFLAPEVLRNKAYNHKMDIWSYGVILYYMTTGKLPFTIKKFQLGYSLDYENIDFKENTKFKSKSSTIQDLILKCLNLDPVERIDIADIVNHSFFDVIKK